MRGVRAYLDLLDHVLTHGVDKDERALQIEREEVERLARDRDDEMAILDRNIYARLRSLILGQTAVKGPKGTLAIPLADEVTYSVEDGVIAVKPVNDSKRARARKQLDDRITAPLSGGARFVPHKITRMSTEAPGQSAHPLSERAGAVREAGGGAARAGPGPPSAGRTARPGCRGTGPPASRRAVPGRCAVHRRTARRR